MDIALKKCGIAIWGWWQGQNFGDNWIKECMRTMFPDAEFLDTSVMNLSKYSFVIIGGGGLWIDAPIMPFLGKLPFNFGVMGLGAELHFFGGRAKRLCRCSSFFFARDQYSLDCMHVNWLQPSADVTFYKPVGWLQDISNADCGKVLFVYRNPATLIPAGDEIKLTSFINKFRQCLAYLTRYTNGTKNNEQVFVRAFRGIIDAFPRLVFRRGKRLKDYAHIMDIKAGIESVMQRKFSTVVEDDFFGKKNDPTMVVGDAGFIISGRYHGVLLAIQRGLPFIAIDMCPKIRSLVSDCGLCDYIIKMDEVEKLPALIDNARKNTSMIRKCELNFREAAIEQVKTDTSLARLIVANHSSDASLRGIHYGSYWMGENDIVNCMADDLARICDLIKVDLKMYGLKKNFRLKKLERTPNGHLAIIKTSSLVHDIEKYRPDFIVLNSGGLTLEEDGFAFCRKNGIIVVGVAMSDPDVFPFNGFVFADKFDLFYTNSRHALEYQYGSSGIRAGLLPFAASTRHHYPIRSVQKKYDIVVVGHARPERLELISKLSQFKIGLFGHGWGARGLGPVKGRKQVEAINSGKIYLSFTPTKAGFQNVKVGLFEAVACKSCVITSMIDELSEYFTIDEEVLCYRDKDDLIGLLQDCLTNENKIAEVRNACYERLLRNHTWVHRWASVLDDIRSLKNDPLPKSSFQNDVMIDTSQNTPLLFAEHFLRTCVFDGLAHSFDVLQQKWVKPYPEVTGYLLSYFCRYRYDEALCLKMGERLLKLQHPTGGFPSFGTKQILYTFDTAQIVVGFLELYRKSGDMRFYLAAIRGGDFLTLALTEKYGFMPTYSTMLKRWFASGRTYRLWNGPWSVINCKVIECLNLLSDVTHNLDYKQHIVKIASYYKQRDKIEFTHPLGYFLEGLVAAGEIDTVRAYLKDHVLPRMRQNGYIPYTEKLPYAYVSGTVQLGLLMAHCGFLDEAIAVRGYARAVQGHYRYGGLLQYADEQGSLSTNIHSEMNCWGTKYFCELERVLATDAYVCQKKSV